MRLYFLINFRKQKDKNLVETPVIKKSFKVSFYVILGFALFVIITAGYMYYKAQVLYTRKNVERELASIAKFKVEQIVLWRKTLLSEASENAEDPLLQAEINKYVEKNYRRSYKILIDHFKTFQRYYNLTNVLLVDLNGNVILSIDKTKKNIDSGAMKALKESFQKHNCVISDIHLSNLSKKPCIDVLLPFFSQNGAPFYGVIFEVNPEEFLYPLIQNWPLPSKSAETLIVRREGNYVIFLNELRFQKNTALKLKISLSDKNVPAVMAVLGVEGVFEGLDYRGVRVICALIKVPDTDWHMVSKIDCSEAMQVLHYKTTYIFLIVLGFLMTIIFLALGVWNREEKKYFLALSKAVQEKERHAKLLDKRNKELNCLYNLSKLIEKSDITLEEILKGAVNLVIQGVNDPEIVCAKITLNGMEYKSENFNKTNCNKSFTILVKNLKVGYLEICYMKELPSPIDEYFFKEESELFNVYAERLGRVIEQKMLEEKLNDLLLKLSQSNNELEQFAYITSHDLQEPLRSIISFAELVKKQSGKLLDEENRDYLERIEACAKRMRQLIIDLLEYSKLSKSEIKFENIDLEGVVHNVVRDLDLKINEVGAEIEIRKLPKIMASHLHIRQLFQNLISNAIKFRKKDEPLRIIIDSKIIDSKFVEITVEDNGIGFDDIYSDKIFKIFKRLHTRDKYEGSGIGLAICEKVVDLHKGKISVKSTLGKGSTFFITLPL